MPNAIAHILIVKRMLMKVGFDDQKMHQNSNALMLGSLGPDPLFYTGLLPPHLHLPTAMKKYGNQIHKTDAREFFLSLCNEVYTVDEENKREKELLQAFILGQFAHYLLDKYTHPYILYMSGFDKDGRITGKYHYQHAYFEQRMDVLLAEKYSFEDPIADPKKFYAPLLNVSQQLQDHLTYIFSKFFKTDKIPDDFYTNGLKNFVALDSYMNKNPKLKSKVFGKNNLGALAYPTWEKKEDLLNDLHETWLDPVAGEKRTESYFDLTISALNDLCSVYEELKREKFHYQAFEKKIDGLDYYGKKKGDILRYHKESI